MASKNISAPQLCCCPVQIWPFCQMRDKFFYLSLSQDYDMWWNLIILLSSFKACLLETNITRSSGVVFKSISCHHWAGVCMWPGSQVKTLFFPYKLAWQCTAYLLQTKSAKFVIATKYSTHWISFNFKYKSPPWCLPLLDFPCCNYVV